MSKSVKPSLTVSKKIDTVKDEILNETRLNAESGGFYALGTKIAIYFRDE
ncbi:hypothetical protein [Acetobacterium malicum]|nr:hypothetical protein [Acetobacterium dehalogenans]